jgi:YHS domain-containing protein
MAYKHTNSKGVTYFLNSKAVVLRGGKEQTIYYFSKDERPEAVKDIPEGFMVNENPRNGFLTVKRIR